MNVAEIIRRVRVLEVDHDKEGWPAIRMGDVTALADEVERLGEVMEYLAFSGVSARHLESVARGALEVGGVVADDRTELRLPGSGRGRHQEYMKPKPTSETETRGGSCAPVSLLDALEAELRRAEDFHARMVNWCALPNIREGAKWQVELAQAALDKEKRRASNSDSATSSP